MEPIHALKKEKTQLRRLKALRARVYKKIAPVDVRVSSSTEPVDLQQRETLVYRRIQKNGIWGRVFDCAWFHMTATIPASARGKHVVLHTNVGGEGLVSNGADPDKAITLISTYLDRVTPGLGKSIIEITPSAEGGEAVDLYLDATYNGYYNVPYGRGIYHYAELCAVDEPMRDYYYDYLTVASVLSVTEEPARRAQLTAMLDESYALAFSDLPQAREKLLPVLVGTPDPDFAITATGHSHLDLAWLWPIRETKRKAARTFANQVNNAARYPDYIYGVSQPWQLDYIKKTHPNQYRQIKEMHARGQLELQGGMWVEADTNLASGEALIRQIWYGTDFFRREFGEEMEICWLPDVFGYNGNLPQIIRKSGLDYFMTIKLSWNEHNRFPYRSFVWQGIDGSEVLVHMPPDETYNSAGTPACTKHARDNYTERDVSKEVLMLYGLGDGGGGPGEAHIELLRRQKQLAGWPTVTFGRAVDFFHRLAGIQQKLPRYSGELYLEKHQGTYTTQGYNKRYNRACEFALQDLETLSAFAATKGIRYPVEEIDAWWKEVLLYQFHDILPGSCVTRVYTESRARYEILLREIHAERDAILAQLGKAQDAPRAVFNPTAYNRTEYLRRDGHWYRAEMKPYAAAALSPAEPQPELKCDGTSIENGVVKVAFGKSGEIVSLVDKASGREYAEGGINVLRVYPDKFSMFNAWDIDWKYYNRAAKTLRAARAETFIDGAEVVRRNYFSFGRSELIQDIVLTPGSRTVQFRTRCDWHTTFRMLRSESDVAVHTDHVRCDIQYGSIDRSTGNTTPEEVAQFEICAHKYVDLSDGEKGISLLNNSKYGHRVKGNRLSLNLLRSPIFPDTKADRMAHEFTYALMPHEGGCGTETLKQSYFLNKPPVDCAGVWDSIVSTDNEAVVVEVVKQAGVDDALIVRLYESQGREARCALKTGFDFKTAVETDLMERGQTPVDPARLQFTAFEIKTLKLRRS